MEAVDVNILKNYQIVEDPTEEEIVEMIMKLINHRSGGENGIPAEFINYGGKELLKRICEMINEKMEENTPERWNNSIICPIHNKGQRYYTETETE